MYIPKILLCGDRENFLQKIGDRPVEIVGQISFKGAYERGEVKSYYDFSDLLNEKFNPEDFQIFWDGMELSFDELKKFMDGAADYIVFENNSEFVVRFNELFLLGLNEKALTADSLLKYADDNFYCYTNKWVFLQFLYEMKFSRVLDVDNFFVNSDLFYLLLNPSLQIDSIDKNPLAEKFPLVENFCRKTYTALEECNLKHYDALLITADRSPEEFIELLKATQGMSGKVLLFARKNSLLSNWLKQNESVFAKVIRSPIVNGDLVYILRFMPPEDFCVYVVTHKDPKLDALPEGYKFIHAGHAQAKQDFGYIGDDTGENISKLNRYLNEITALYWMYQNTRHEIIGLAHYRRFFTLPQESDVKDIAKKWLDFEYEKILTPAQAKEILQDYDIIICRGMEFLFTQNELKSIVCDEVFNKYVEKIFRKYIAEIQPDYLEAFDYVTNSHAEFMYEMFITRRNVFEAYCKWLFSFVVHVTAEVINTTNVAAIDNSRQYRCIGLIAERLMTVWLMKKHLKIKLLPIMFRKGI